MEKNPRPEHFNTPPSLGGSERPPNSKKKKGSKEKQGDTRQSETAPSSSEGADGSLDFRRLHKGIVEGSVFERILPKKPFEDKKEAPKPAEAVQKELADHSDVTEEAEEAQPAEPLTQEAVIEEVLSASYQEVRPGNIEEAVEQYRAEKEPELELEKAALSPEDAEGLAAVAYVEQFLKEAREGVRQPAEDAAEPTAQRSPGEVFQAAYEAVAARAWREHGPDESTPGVPVSEALDNRIGSSAGGMPEDGSAIDYEDIDNLSNGSGSTYATRGSGAAGGMPPGYGTNGYGSGGGRSGLFGHHPAAPTPRLEAYAPTTDPRNIIAPVLLAGLAGLWFGNRHGRKKERKVAEARILPLQQQLEIKEIEQRAVRAELAKKETQIRQMVYEHTAALTAADTRAQTDMRVTEAATQSPVSEVSLSQGQDSSEKVKNTPPKPLFERLAEAAPLAAAAGLAAEATSAEPVEADSMPNRPSEERVPVMPPSLLEQPANRLRQPTTSTQEISASSLTGAKAEAAQPYPKPVEAMSQKELLDAADKILVGNESVRQVYESRDIGDASLRRIVAEYQRGGDVHRVLVEEKVKSSYERDPRLRARSLPSSPVAGGSSQSTVPISYQPPQALPSGLEKDEPLLSPPARHPLLTAHDESPVPSALVVANIVAFIILAMLFIVWLFVRS